MRSAKWYCALRRYLFLATLLAPAALSAVAQETWDRTHVVCDSQGSGGALCNALIAYHRLDEPADYFRGSQTGGAMAECPGTDVATTATAKFGLARSASFDGSSSKGFIVPGGGGFGSGTWTVALWVYPTSATITSTILSTQSAQSGKEGIVLDLYYTGSQLRARVRSYMQDADSVLTAENATNLTANIWHLLVFQSGHSTIRKLYSTNQLKVSVDNGPFTSSTWTNAPRVNSMGHMVIGKSMSDVDKETGACLATGGGFTGYMQGLAFWQRALTAADISLLYNGGSGNDFPFAN